MASKSSAMTRGLLWSALLVTLGLVAWQASQEDAPETALPQVKRHRPLPVASVIPPRETALGEAASGVPMSGESVSRKHESSAPMAVIDPTATLVQGSAIRVLPDAPARHALFAAHEWLPPPPKPEPPPPPKAPPLPYSYVGSLQEMPQGSVVILMQQKKMVMPVIGSQLSGQWRLDREDAQSVYFTFLPLNQKVVLSKTRTAANAARASEVENNPQEEMQNQ